MGAPKRGEDVSRPVSDVIRSPANPIVKYVRSLGRRSIRRRERAFVVEGVRAVLDAEAAGARPALVLLREGVGAADALGLEFEDATVRVVEPALFDDLCETVHPQGVLAVVPHPELPIPAVRAPLYLVVDGVRDPGNLGTLLRAAAAAGATAVFLGRGTVDAYNPKVVRAAMGAHFRLPIRELEERHLELIRETAVLRVVARVGDHPPHDALDWRQPAALIVASETGSESAPIAELATKAISIPMAAGVESLNAAIAGAVILFEAARQRRRGPKRSAAVGRD